MSVSNNIPLIRIKLLRREWCASWRVYEKGCGAVWGTRRLGPQRRAVDFGRFALVLEVYKLNAG